MFSPGWGGTPSGLDNGAETRNERRTRPQRSANKLHLPHDFKYATRDESSGLVARDPRPTKNVQLFERDGNQVNMASKDVPQFLMHTEVLDSACEVHVADETDFPGYEVQPTDDSRAGRGFNVADGKSIPNKGEAVPQFELDGENGEKHNLQSKFQIAKVSKPLRSVSMICDAGFDVLFTSTEASVRDPTSGKTVCKYLRQGGLYTGEMRLRNPLHPSFGRPGQ